MDMRGSKDDRGDLRDRVEWARAWRVYSPLRKGRARRWDLQPSLTPDQGCPAELTKRGDHSASMLTPLTRAGNASATPQYLSRRVFTAVA